MSVNAILIQLVGLSCILILLRAPYLPRGWVIAAGLILMALAGTYWLAPAWAGIISGGLWGILIILPCLGLTWVNHLVAQEQYGQACQLAAYIRWLHPADGLFEYPKFLHALYLGHQGHIEEALQIFSRCRTTTSTGRLATALMYRLEGRWDELLTWMQDSFSEKSLFDNATLSVHYLRALGETGDLNGLLQRLELFKRNSEPQLNPSTLNLVRLFALAFCGQVESVQRLFKGPLSGYSQNIRQFWLATAELAAGRELVARKQLLALREQVDTARQNAINWRLSQTRVNPEQTLTEASKQILQRIEIAMQEEARYDLSRGFLFRRAYATWGMIGVNGLVFVVEVLSGGSQDLDNLYRLGGLVPEDVLAGDWWRLLSSTFLHAGFSHLLLNMLALYFLGAFVESILGAGRLLLAYFVSGVGSMLTITILAIVMSAPDQLVVGASGAIMGLLGVIGAILLSSWRRERSRIAVRRLQFIFFVIGFQVVFDLAMPEVSFLGHIAGLIWGFLLGSFLVVRRHS